MFHVPFPDQISTLLHAKQVHASDSIAPTGVGLHRRPPGTVVLCKKWRFNQDSSKHVNMKYHLKLGRFHGVFHHKNLCKTPGTFYHPSFRNIRHPSAHSTIVYCVCPHSIHLVAVIDRSRNSRHPRNPRISKGATFDFSTDGFFHGIQRQEIHGLYNPIKKVFIKVSLKPNQCCCSFCSLYFGWMPHFLKVNSLNIN